MIGRMLEWERTKRENAKAVDARGKSAKEENLSKAKEAKAARLTAETEKREAKAAKVEAKKEAKRAKKQGYAGRDMEAVLTDSERSEILAGEMKRLMGWTSPWRVTAKGDTWAQLVDPAADPMGPAGVGMAVATLGVSLATTPIRRGRDRDHTLYVDVTPNGTIERTGYWLYAGKDYSNVPEVSNKEL